MAPSSAPAVGAEHRILPERPIGSLARYEETGGGAGLFGAMAVEREVVLAELEASGLRGRGGAGFPTGTKWRTILSFGSDASPTTVVVNAAEGEPGTYKDRLLLERNPYAVLEGAMIAAHVAGASTIVIATKQAFPQTARVRTAIAEIARASWNPGFEFVVVEGPREYLYGEETALLEVVDGRPPFPRIAPPWRRGLLDVVDDDERYENVAAGSGLAGDVELGTDTADNVVPPVLVNNVETFANVGLIIAKGADWFRSVGTPKTPGTLLCTVTGAVSRPGVYEVVAGTPFRDVLALAQPAVADEQAESPSPPAFVLLGVSNAILTSDQFDTPLSHEAFAAIGTGLGSASFIVVDSVTDPVAVAAGVSRFLAVESCGQCTPCKQDGLEISAILDELCAGTAKSNAGKRLDKRLGTVVYGARCNLATQQQTVISSIRSAFPLAFRARMQPGAEPVDRTLVAELVSLEGPNAEIDTTFERKQPNWTYDLNESGQTPVERLTDHRAD
jgi:NADH:ubiquinone oxidoreductase subunit F (NADH-binding)